MGWLAAVVALVVAFGIIAPRRDPPPARPAPDPPAPDPTADDQVELLYRYGTSDDAEHLIAEGRGDDLAGLGYRPD